MNVFPQELQAARTRLAFDRPYLAAALWSLQAVGRRGLGTMAVDARWRLYYDPEVIAQWTREQVAGVLYHEVLHLLRDHAERCLVMNAEKGLWNVAADCELNDDLVNEKITLPDDPLMPAQFGLPNGKLAEEYYAELDKQRDAKRPSPPGGGHRQQAGGGRSGKDQQSGAGQNGEGVGKPAPGTGSCGSCAHGQREDWEEPLEGGETPGISKAEAEIIRRQVAEEIREHSRSRGDVPGHLKRWAEAKLNPKVDWRRVLAAAVRRAVTDIAGAVDYSYSRPSRRQGQAGNGKVILPALRRPVPEVAVVVDTSGSMSDTLLSQALAEVSGVLKAAGLQQGVTVLAVDARVHICRKVFRPEQVHLAGGGGTDMGAGLEAATKLRPRPQVVVVLTDGYTPWPSQPPQGMKVVVGLLSDGTAPEWARTVRIEV